MAFLTSTIIRRSIGSLAALTLLTGCYQDFDPDIATPSVLCMNSNIVNDEPIEVELTRTWRWDEGTPGENGMDITVTDAVMKLYVNDTYVETLEMRPYKNDIHSAPTFQPSHKYYADYTPSPGDVITLTAESRSYGNAEARVAIPQPPVITKVNVDVTSFTDESTPGREDCTMNASLKVWFSDDGASQDYYKFAIDHTPYRSQYNDDYDLVACESISYWADYDREPLFTEHISVLESAIAETSGYTIFSDRQIQGRSYPLHIELQDLSYNLFNPSGLPDYGNGALYMVLGAISESYYRHVLSVWVANDGITGILGSVGLAAQVSEASNVSTRAGVVAASAKVKFPVSMRQIIDIARNNSSH